MHFLVRQLIYRVIPKDIHRFYIWIAEMKGKQPYTRLHESTPRSRLVYSDQSPFPPACSSGQVNEWLVISAQLRTAKRAAHPVHLL